MHKKVLIYGRNGKPWSQRIRHFFLIFFVLSFFMFFVNMNMIRYFGEKNRVRRESAKLQLCLEGTISPPCNLMHDMNDKELFRRATLASRIKEYPYKRVTKVAFMFLTKGPLPLAPLWERFFQGNQGLYSIYIHSSPGYQANYSRSSVFYGRQIPSQVVHWGKMSMCDAERRLLANAMLDLSNEHFVLLSESCIPIYNFTVVYSYIAKSRYSFMGSYDDPGRDGRGRYNRSMKPEVTLEQWRKGSQWFEVNRELALPIVEDTTYYPKFKQFCTRYCYEDEHYFPTMLTILAPHLLANRTLTYVDWSEGAYHPDTFGKDNITKVLFLNRIMGRRLCFYNDRLVNVCHLFARKFNSTALKPLLGLSKEVFGY